MDLAFRILQLRLLIFNLQRTLFIDANHVQVDKIVFQRFKLVFRLKINYYKFEIMGIRVDVNQVEFSSIFGYHTGTLNSSYLELPFCVGSFA